MPEVSDPTVRRELPKAGSMTVLRRLVHLGLISENEYILAKNKITVLEKRGSSIVLTSSVTRAVSSR